MTAIAYAKYSHPATTHHHHRDPTYTWHPRPRDCLPYTISSPNRECNPHLHSQILEGYLLQGIDGKALADKVLQCFTDAIHDVTTRVVRSLLLTKPK